MAWEEFEEVMERDVKSQEGYEVPLGNPGAMLRRWRKYHTFRNLEVKYPSFSAGFKIILILSPGGGKQYTINLGKQQTQNELGKFLPGCRTIDQILENI